MLEINTIADRTGLSERQLRYAADHRLVPGEAPAPPGRGRSRVFTREGAFALALVAALRVGGLGRRAVARTLAWLEDRLPLRRLAQNGGHRLEVANGGAVRLTPSAPRGRGRKEEWFRIGPGPWPPVGAPLVLVQIDLAELWRRLAEGREG